MLTGQFSYATVPEPGPYSDADGWKVKQILPDDSSDQEMQRLVESATGALGGFVPVSLPLLASRAEIDALPRRLRLESFPGRKSVLLHQVSAGQSHHSRDSSFTHGLLVQCDGGRGIDDIRPAELWDSPVWLRPAGSDEVAAATLVSPVPLTDAPRVSTVEELWTHQRPLALLLLSVLENAFTAENSGGPTRIALIDPTGALTAGWVAFLSRHLTPGAAWQQLTFSTHERSVETTAHSMTTLRVIGIPAEEAAGARRALGTDWLVVDPADLPSVPTDPVAGWELPKGRRLPLGPWTQLAERLTLLDEMGMGSVVELVDRLAGWCAGSSDDRPLWAIPAGLLTADPEVLDLMMQVAPDAAALARAQWPASLTLSAERQETVVAALTRFSPSAVAAFGAILRGADSTGHGPADLVLEGYLKALWGRNSQGVPPEWVASLGPLPWLPAKVQPSAKLADSMATGIVEMVSWVWSAGAEAASPAETVRLRAPDPIAGVRLLSSVTEVFARWGIPDRSPALTEITTHLVEFMVTTLRAHTPVAEGTWPRLREPWVDAVSATLSDLIRTDPSVTVGPVAARWLDRQLGRLDPRVPLPRWSLLDLDRALYLAPEQNQEAGAHVLRAAGVLRHALGQANGRWWQPDAWLNGLRQIFGAPPDPQAARWFLEVVVARGVPAPILAIGELLLAGMPLGPAEHALGRWLASPPVTGSASTAPFPPIKITAFPLVSVHAWCRPELPVSGDLRADGEFRRELQTLVSAAPATTGRLWEGVQLRTAIDILAVDSAFVASGSWPWGRGIGPHLQSALANWWEAAFAALNEASAGEPGRRLALARSLFVRALISNVVHEQRINLPYSDPVGEYLTALMDVSKEEWRVEIWVKELIGGADRTLKQQWIVDVREEAARAAGLLTGGGSHSQGFGQALLGLVDANAPALALGALGSRLPFNRPRAAKRNDEGSVGQFAPTNAFAPPTSSAAPGPVGAPPTPQRRPPEVGPEGWIPR